MKTIPAILAVAMLWILCQPRVQPQDRLEQLPKALKTQAGFEPQYRIIHIEDFSYPAPEDSSRKKRIMRKVVRAVLEKELKGDSLEAAAKYMLGNIYLKTRASAVVLYLYSDPTEVFGPFTVAKAQWENSAFYAQIRPGYRE